MSHVYERTSSVETLAQASAIERMALAGVKDSLPTNGMFNREQLDAMKSERMPTYRRIAEVMLAALLEGKQ